jgi:glycosyltransferase involved in cell wall biosynthesis
MAALSELFDGTRIVVPVNPIGRRQGESPLTGHNLVLVALSARSGTGLTSKLTFLPWLLRNGWTITKELRSADAVHAPIPGDVGTVGMLAAWFCRKPLFVRYCGNWGSPKTLAEKFWHWFMESFAGGRNVMLATGGDTQPPSIRNSAVRWIFSTSLTGQELKACGIARRFPASGILRLVHVGRQEPKKGADVVIRALPALLRQFPEASLEIIGQGSAIPLLREITEELQLKERVVFRGKLNHSEVMNSLKHADLFCFPTTSSEGFPKAVLEALASGLPVVTTRVSVLPRLLARGCGQLLDQATPDAVAQAVRGCLSNAETYQAMSLAAVQTAAEYSLESWAATIKNYCEAAWGPLKKDG